MGMGSGMIRKAARDRAAKLTQMNADAQARLMNPAYTDPAAYRKDLDTLKAAGITPPNYGPGGPSGGPASLGQRMQGPYGATMPGMGPVQWLDIPASFKPGSMQNPAGGGLGRMQWQSIPASMVTPRRDTQPVDGANQMAQAAAIRQRIGQ